MSLPAGVDVNGDVTRCAVLVDVQQEADVQLQETGNASNSRQKYDLKSAALSFSWGNLKSDSTVSFATFSQKNNSQRRK